MGSDEAAEPATAAAAAAARTAAAAGAAARDQADAGEDRHADPAAAAEEVIRGVRFEALVAVAYHAAREVFLSRLGRCLTGSQVVLGTAAVAALGDMLFPVAAPWLAALGAFVGVVALILDPASAAREHRALRSRYYELIAAIEEDAPTEALARCLRGKLWRLRSGEPPTYRAVGALAYNAAVDATEPDRMAAATARLVVPRFDRAAANVLPFRGRVYLPAG